MKRRQRPARLRTFIIDDEGQMTGDSPTVARRRVRLALREAREAAELTQSQIAERMEWSLSKVVRIESGDVSITPNDLRPLLSYMGVEDRARVNALIADAKIARTRQRQAWYEASEYRQHLTDTSRRLYEYEAEAVAIRYYQVFFLPGPLQTADYASALMAKYEAEMHAEEIRWRLDARGVRREKLLSRLGSVRVFVLLDESVLRRYVGGAAVLADQLRELHRLAMAESVEIRMIPFALDAPITNNASFDLLTLGESGGGEVLYRETGFTNELIEDQVTAKRHSDRYGKLWRAAACEVDTVSYLSDQIKSLESLSPSARRP